MLMSGCRETYLKHKRTHSSADDNLLRVLESGKLWLVVGIGVVEDDGHHGSIDSRLSLLVDQIRQIRRTHVLEIGDAEEETDAI